MMITQRPTPQARPTRARSASVYSAFLALLPFFVAISACGREGEGRSARTDAARRDAAPVLVSLDAPLTRGVSPGVTADTSGRLHYVFVTMDSAGVGHLFTMRDGAAPRELIDPLGAAQFDPETPPKLAVAPDGSLALSYAVSVPDSTAKYKSLSGLRFVRSTDGGTTWSAPVTIADDGDLARYRNDHTMHVGRDGAVYVAWLDERAADTTRLFVSHSADNGATWSRNVAVSRNATCECCRTPIAAGPDGAVYTAWRTILPGGLRDIVVARSSDKGATWSAPVLVHADSFAINGCPDAGPAIAVDASNRLHVAWWTGREGRAGVKHTYSDDAGTHFAAPQELGVAAHSKAAHAQLAIVGREGVAVAWDDGTTAPPRIVLRTSNDRGRTFGALEYLSAPGASASFPVLAVRHDSLSVVWAEKGESPITADAPTSPNMPAPWRLYDGRGLVRLVRAEVPLP